MIDYFFHWYNGAVWANLVASAITGALAATWSVRRMKKHHQKKHDEMMYHVSRINKQLKIKE